MKYMYAIRAFICVMCFTTNNIQMESLDMVA